MVSIRSEEFVGELLGDAGTYNSDEESAAESDDYEACIVIEKFVATVQNMAMMHNL